MTTKDAYQLGVASGLESAEYGDFSPEELSDEDSFLEAASELLENKREFADSPTYEFRGRNSEELFDAFDRGETEGLRQGWKMRQRQHRSTPGEANPARRAKLMAEARRLAAIVNNPNASESARREASFALSIAQGRLGALGVDQARGTSIDAENE